jgi:AbrB family looped-hinge helix DNA binding protein
MAADAIVTSKGQLVIPAELRRRYRIRKGTRVRFKEVAGGILMRPITDEYIDSLRGIAARPGMPVDIEREPDMR